MTQTTEHEPDQTAPSTDLVAEVRRVLQASPEPLTLSKIRSQLPSSLRGISLEALAEALRRQVAANVLIQYPKYRSQQDRFWDRPMSVHVAQLIRTALEEGPLGWSELRRKLPAYALGQAEAVLQEQLTQGLLYRHPQTGPRGKERFGVEPPDPKDYLRPELTALFGRLGRLGFSDAQLRAGAMELLHSEEWATARTAGPEHLPPAAAEEERQAARPAPETGAEPAPPETAPVFAGGEENPY
jgi:hypothetical protein